MSLNRKIQPYPIENLHWNENLVKIIHRSLAVVMITCMTVPLVMLLNRIFPDWQGAYVIPLVFVVAIEAFYTHHRMRKVNIIEPRWWYSRLAEIVVILVSLKFLLFAIRGFDQFWLELPLWRQDFFASFFERDYLLLILLMIPIWIGCGEIDNLFNQIEVDEQLLLVEYDAGFSEERADVRRALANLIIVVGGLMVSLVALINIEGGRLSSGSVVVQRGLVSTLIYFLCGLILLSLTQFSILRTRWVINRVVIDRKVTVNWFIYTLILILGLGFIVVVLPTGYSGQLLLWLQIVLGFLLAAIQFLLYLLSLPFILLISWIMSLFNRPVKNLPQPPPVKLLPLPEAISQETAPWFELVKSILFWVILVGLIGYAFYYYLREHPEYFSWIHQSQLWSRFAQFWKKLSTWVLGVNRQIVTAVQSTFQRTRSQAGIGISTAQRRFTNPRWMTPRQQIIFYYLSLIRRATERGMPRELSQTPLEYADRLKGYLGGDKVSLDSQTESTEESVETQAITPEMIEAEIARVTEGFMEARYSRHVITGDEAGVIRLYWQRILKLIRNTP